MNLRELCNLAYSFLSQGRDRAQMAELNALLSPPDEKERTIDQMNAESMRQLLSPEYGLIGPRPA